MFSSNLFTREEVVRALKNPSPALGPMNGPGSPDIYRKSWKGEFGSRQVLATPAFGISPWVGAG